MCKRCVEWGGRVWHINPSNGYYEARVRLHREVWAQANGPIPGGHHVHHRDRDKANNAIENLELLSHSEHSSRHIEEKIGPYRAKALHNSLAAQRRLAEERSRRNLVCVLCGGEYHSAAKHPRKYCSRACIDRVRYLGFRGESRRCERCGEPYEATRRAQRYCSKRCNTMSAADRAADSIERTVACAHCGKEFTSARCNARFCGRDCAVRYHSHRKVCLKVGEVV